MENNINVVIESHQENPCMMQVSNRQEEKSSSHLSCRNDHSKRGFRIDDILFSVENNSEKNFKAQTAGWRGTPSPSNSSLSSHTSVDEMSRLSPISFVKGSKSAHLTNTLEPIDARLTDQQDVLPPPPSSFPTKSNYQMSSDKGYAKGSDFQDVYRESSNDSKKPRTSFTPDQIQTLEDSFNEKHYLNHTERMTLAEELNLTDCQIKTWFQNRRMKMKRQYKEAVEKGFLIPYHPYPFPRYSRLTPAHFASVPILNSRHLMARSGSSNYVQVTRGCTCCSTSNRMYSHNPYNKSMRTTSREYEGLLRRPSTPPDVLPRRRSLERKDLHMQYKSELREYFQKMPLKNGLKEHFKKYL